MENLNAQDARADNISREYTIIHAKKDLLSILVEKCTEFLGVNGYNEAENVVQEVVMMYEMQLDAMSALVQQAMDRNPEDGNNLPERVLPKSNANLQRMLQKKDLEIKKLQT
jgi:hypothetical protein